jgi:ABC-type nitrate/sulfonate/bicarbonate transport system substrate-binding protein
MINMGMLDFITAVRRDVADFYWVFYGWQGIHARLEGVAFDFLPLPELADVLDYYTPVIITNERMIERNPETVRRFLRALGRGYRYAVLHPAEGAQLLIDQVPELDPELARASQAWIAAETAAELDRWGHQKEEVWRRFAEWALENGLIDHPIDPLTAFSNRFLPEAGDG